jgi:two-component system sensor histidine kinase RegB
VSPVLNLGWLVRLRWALLSTAAALVLLVATLGGGVPWGAMLAVLAGGAASNAAIGRWFLGAGARASVGIASVALAMDVVGLTLLLALSGGAHNPFAFLYLLLVMVAAWVLPARGAWFLAALGGLAYGGLFLAEPPAAVHDPQAMRRHLVGMWVAYAVCVPFIAVGVARLRALAADAEAQLAAARAAQARTERLASLATLAAGAAHELATPLGTIAVVAGELARSGDPAVAEDGALVSREVERCRSVLLQLSADAGAGRGEPPRPVALAPFVRAALAEFGDRVHLTGAAPGRVVAPEQLVAQALRRLVANALQASPPGEPVVVSIGAGQVTVTDQGSGMSPEVLARVGEPFFTTRSPGEGMGLGVYFARSVISHAGGALVVASTPGKGTTATVTLPVEAA